MLMADYYEKMIHKNRQIMLLDKRSVIPYCVVQVITPKFILEPMIVLSTDMTDDTLLCLYLTQDLRKENIENFFGDYSLTKS